MNKLSSPAGLARLDQIVRPDMLCVFDFDGTLSPITPQPHQAEMPREILDRMLRLAELAPIGVLTGRSVDDIRERLGFEPQYLVGNHGLEGVPGWEADQARHEQDCRSWRARLEECLADQAQFDPGIAIEDKRFSLSVHYRQVTDQEAMAAKLAALFLQMEPPPRVISGKCVFNLLPQGAADKGVAMERLMEISGAQSAIYVGDDVTDEDVFRLRRPDILSVRVEYLADSAAEFFIPDHADIAGLLDDLTKRLQELKAGRGPGVRQAR